MPNTAKLLDLCRTEFDTKNWTYDALSDKSSVARSTVVNYITGKVETPKRHVVESLCNALGIDPDAPLPDESRFTVLTHCDRCRAEQNEHNRVLREDFNERFNLMRNAYVEHEKVIKEHYEARIAEIKEANNKSENSWKFRFRCASFGLLALAILNGIATLIDALNGNVGWLRFAYGSSNHEIIEQVIKYVASFLA